MSALALKTLTAANTARNQVQLAALETAVVRRPGARPESPTSRVKNSLEKQRADRGARAERRARREGEGDVGKDEGVEGGAVEERVVDEEEKVDANGVPLRHRRGAGDEEDYETPPRPERPAKRGRFAEPGAKGGGEDEREGSAQEGKRVKWDRGLHTTTYFDAGLPNPKWNVRAVPSSKGCLASAAKALRLDTLGNVLNAELPVGGLVKEHVIVQKFVFEDDEVPEIQVPVPPPKNTRSKRKAKTPS
ncbi:uncharacterized protein BXZ73DRAFT_86352 [Epithele typhae]|uniref:uncharacterized protein n=1 Tax=Epithele typhae TaxID=378194 RepID=UPI00200748D5|nr:uncharacterized protein BXZ73DRAFT_86352 [Epithele typhae]KAH9946171.1 hypothetical protein BXZ73DRAFT_86352 [Epithele typhae]